MTAMQNSESRPAFPPWIAIGVAILAVSTASIFIRFAQQNAPSIVIAAYRLTIATLILAPAALLRHRDAMQALRPRQWLLLALSGVLLAFHFATWITSLEMTSVASSVVLVTTTPLWVALLSPVLLREKISAPVWVGLGVALAGGTVVALSEMCGLGDGRLVCASGTDLLGQKALLGNVLALCGAICAAGYLIIGRKVRPALPLPAYTFLVYGMAALTLLVMVAVRREALTGYPAQTYVWFLLLALIPQLIGHSTFNWALKYLPAAVVSITLLGEPVGSVILAFILLNEVPASLELIGGALILVGIFLAARK